MVSTSFEMLLLLLLLLPGILPHFCFPFTCSWCVTMESHKELPLVLTCVLAVVAGADSSLLHEFAETKFQRCQSCRKSGLRQRSPLACLSCVFVRTV